jgi:hypothetical protein
MARDVAVMFDEMKALADRHAALHADQARLQAELEQARAELARARRRTWSVTPAASGHDDLSWTTLRRFGG